MPNPGFSRYPGSFVAPNCFGIGAAGTDSIDIEAVGIGAVWVATRLTEGNSLRADLKRCIKDTVTASSVVAWAIAQ